MIRVGEVPEGIVVRYRLSVSGHGDPVAVHQSLRDDLRRVLTGLSALSAPPEIWDLAEMARAQAVSGPAGLAYEADTDYDWERPPAQEM